MNAKTAFYALIFLFISAGSVFAEETIQERVQKILNDKTVEDPYKRFIAAKDTLNYITSDMSFEETRSLFIEILMPFADKETNDKRKRNEFKAEIYYQIACKAGEEGDDDAEEAFIEKSMEYAELSGNDVVRALCYYEQANVNIRRGSIQVALDYLYQAINLYEAAQRFFWYQEK